MVTSPDKKVLHNPLLRWVFDLASLLSNNEIEIPSNYRNQVLQTKKLLEDDPSGLANSMLDFAISAALVEFSVETTNPTLTEKLNDWLKMLNMDLLGRVPVGVEALAKEYFRERWKGSSFLLLRTIWGTQDGLRLPTKVFFVDGEDIVVSNGNKDAVVLGGEQYKLRIGDDSEKWPSLPKLKNEQIFIQKPYDSWTNPYPVPFLIRRGVFRNIKFLDLVAKAGQKVMAKALHYLLMMKKGTEALALTGDPENIYSNEDLKATKEAFGQVIQDQKTVAGVPTYVTNFDTEIEHLIPDYQRVLNQSLYSPIEQLILSGLGLVEIVEGSASTRRESILNPKPFISEINQAVKDFKNLLTDILYAVVRENANHKKYAGQIIKVHASSVSDFITDNVRDHLRSMYDRGVLSRETYSEVVGDMDYDVELNRRRQEKKDGQDEDMYPPVINNQEGVVNEPDLVPKDNVPPDKQGPEKKNYKSAIEETEDDERDYEEAPYKRNQDLPKEVKVLPSGGQTIWRKAFNNAIDSYDEETAIKVAWSAVKKVYKKVGDKWVRKSKSEIEESMKELDVKELTELAQLQILGKKNKLLDKLLKEDTENTNQ